jgi:hypothetical protein
MLKKMVYHGCTHQKRGPVLKFLDKCEDSVVEDFRISADTLSRNSIESCQKNRKLYEKVSSYKNHEPLYELKVTGPQNKKYRLLFIERTVSDGEIVVYFLHGYIEKSRGHLRNHYMTAFRRAKSIPMIK